MTPGEKPSATTSEMAIRRRAMASPSGWRTLSEIPRFPEFLLLNWPPMSGSVTPGRGPLAWSRRLRPPTGAMAAIRVSGWAFHSTLITSAPSAARKRVPPAEARNQLKSKIRIPCRANGFPRAERVRAASADARASANGVRV